MSDDGTTKPDDSADPAGADAARAKQAGYGDSMHQTVESLTALYTNDTPVSPQMTDAITQALLMVLGSGPSMAAYDSLLQAQQANGLMYQNAVANQQKTNILGMAMTAKCVRYMLDPNAPDLDADIANETKR
jgi:Killing trait